MTYFYYKTTKTWNGQPQYKQMTNSEEETIELWKHLSDKKNWRIVQLPNGYYQTEYRDIRVPPSVSIYIGYTELRALSGLSVSE